MGEAEIDLKRLSINLNSLAIVRGGETGIRVAPTTVFETADILPLGAWRKPFSADHAPRK